VHTDEKSPRKDSPGNGDAVKDAVTSVRLELMRYPNIKKLKSERLDTLAMDILTRLSSMGALAIHLNKTGNQADSGPAPERKTRNAAGDRAHG
jgi:predicted RNA-binding protein (virulence factor B family)